MSEQPAVWQGRPGRDPLQGLQRQPSVSWVGIPVGAVRTFLIESGPDVQHDREYRKDGIGPLAYARESGKPKWVAIFTIIDESGNERGLWARMPSNLQQAILMAQEQAGCIIADNRWAALQIRYDGDDPKSEAGLTPARAFSARILPPGNAADAVITIEQRNAMAEIKALEIARSSPRDPLSANPAGGWDAIGPSAPVERVAGQPPTGGGWGVAQTGTQGHSGAGFEAASPVPFAMAQDRATQPQNPDSRFGKVEGRPMPPEALAAMANMDDETLRALGHDPIAIRNAINALRSAGMLPQPAMENEPPF